MQIFIVLSDPQASISTAIFVGRAEFETHINRITVDVCSFSSSTTTSPPPLSPSPSPSVPPTSPDHPVASPSPLLRDVGSTSIAAAPSQARMQAQPPLPFPKGCGRFSFARRGIWGGRKTRGTHEVGGPGGELRNMSHDICRGSFSLSVFLSLTDASYPATRTKRDPDATTLRGDTTKKRKEMMTRKRDGGRVRQQGGARRGGGRGEIRAGGREVTREGGGGERRQGGGK